MKKLEEIIKEKLEGYECPLPEGSLERFQARRASGTGAVKRRPVFWAVATTSAVAAALAIVFILQKQNSGDNGPVNSGTEAIATAEVATFDAVLEPVQQPQPLTAQAIVQPSHTATHQQRILTHPTEQPQEQPAQEPQPDQLQHQNQEKTQTQVTQSEVPHQAIAAGDISTEVKIGKIVETGFCAGSAAALATVFFVTKGFGIHISNGEIYDSPSGPGMPQAANHQLSPNFGVTVSLPVSNRWHLITGAEYELDHSVLMAGSENSIDQYAHYLCIPMRMDWTVASVKGLDLYLGGGIKGNFCLAATRNSVNMQKLDAPFVSLIGVGGLQYHITKTLGVYVEPEANFSMPSSYNQIKTDPWSFVIATGLRININSGKQL